MSKHQRQRPRDTGILSGMAQDILRTEHANVTLYAEADRIRCFERAREIVGTWYSITDLVELAEYLRTGRMPYSEPIETATDTLDMVNTETQEGFNHAQD